MQPARPETSLAMLAEVTRNGHVESCHVGAIAVVDATGILIASAGDIDRVTFLRSSAKPFQAIPLIATGAADRFGFSDAEIALACGSHNGEPLHTRTAEEMVRKAGLSIQDLKCGCHEPYNKAIAEEQRRLGQSPHVLQNNCSGKHAGMLAVACHLEEPTAGYIQPGHKVQTLVHAALGEFARTDPKTIPYGIDGCGVPTFALPLRTMALMFARLMSPGGVSDSSASAARRITSAMMDNPVMIGGDHEFDTELMRATRGRVISKIGAEGIWCAALLLPDPSPRALGIAMKIIDGSTRARSVIAMEVLHQLGFWQNADHASLEGFREQTIRNNRGENVGVIRPNLRLHFQ